jgi:bifunctional ADP-heptose synthase (sugar kinase/adenylyltransferase)
MDLFAGVEFLKPNWRELRDWWGRETPGEGKELQAFLGDVRRMLRISFLMVTRGAKGLWLHAGKRLVHVPAVAREVYDVTGAGDTVLAAFVLAYLTQKDPVEAARFASVAAACEVEHLGATPVTLEEVEALYKDTADRLMEQTRIMEVDA